MSSDETFFLTIIIGFASFVLTLIISFAGSKRNIGFGWSFLLGCTLSPIVSFVAVVLSDRNDENDEGSTKRKWGCLAPLILEIAIISVIFIYFYNYNVEKDEARIQKRAEYKYYDNYRY